MLVSLLGWRLKEKACSVQRLAASYPEFLPTILLERREKENMVMASLDVRDAFLTVKLEETPWSIQQMPVELHVAMLWGRCCLDSATEVCCGIVNYRLSEVKA